MSQGPDSRLPWETLQRAAECLKTIAHPQRLRMIELLLDGRYTVGELAEACSLRSHQASEHLRLMKDRGFLGSERKGRRVYYFVVEPGLRDILACVRRKFTR